MASRVWREIGAHVITDLIVETPQTSKSRLSNLNGTEPALDFTRFDIYAPFVKQITVYCSILHGFDSERRRVFAGRAKKGRLLPNVTSLTLMTSDLDSEDIEALLWFDLLLTPSLRELRVEPVAKTCGSWSSDRVASNLLEKLGTACPAIEGIEFYPRDTKGDSRRNAYNLAHVPWLFHPRDFSLFIQLQSITSSICILDDGGLETLGALPRLKSLELYGCDEQPKGLKFSVSDDSFPCLIHLSLLYVDNTNLPLIMGIKPLSSSLTYLRITQMFGNEEKFKYDRCEDWLSRTLPGLFEHTSHLRTLIFDATQMPEHSAYSNTYGINSMSLLQVISRLPLQHIFLCGIDFRSAGFFEYLPAAFPQLLSLELSHQHMHTADLTQLAKLSNLRYLVLDQTIQLKRPLPPTLPDPRSPLETIHVNFNPDDYRSPVGAGQVAR
ncbi:hypothetical protein FRC09_018226 [Ceratobasidium sp. 395]|nr:hypothetical protein FRC09_018226 [Ceratobasidium sp. 395]